MESRVREIKAGYERAEKTVKRLLAFASGMATTEPDMEDILFLRDFTNGKQVIGFLKTVGGHMSYSRGAVDKAVAYYYHWLATKHNLAADDDEYNVE